MIFYSIVGISVCLVRLTVGIIDGSLLLILFGIWGAYTCMILTGVVKVPPFPAKVTDPESSPGITVFRKPTTMLQLLLMVLMATVLLGIGMTCVKSFFRIYMGMAEGLPGLFSLMTIMATVIFWEGGGLALFAAKKGMKIKTRLHILLGMAVFIVSAAAFFFGGGLLLTEPACGFFLSLFLFIRITGNLLVGIPVLFAGDNIPLMESNS